MKYFETFVLMPFGTNGEYSRGTTESDFVYEEIIKPGVLAAAKLLNCDTMNEATNPETFVKIIREVDKNQSGSISSSIVRGIARADVVVVDMTGRNPNVFLELGIRFAIRSKVTVLLAQVATEIPFDITQYRYIQYEPFKPHEARKRITDFILRGFSDVVKSDSIVFDTLPTISVTIPGMAECYGEEVIMRRDVMSWEDYMNRIEEICSYLRLGLLGVGTSSRRLGHLPQQYTAPGS